MKSRLFHTIVVCGAALGFAPLGCVDAVEADPEAGDASRSPAGVTDAGALDGHLANRCRLPQGGCGEHCTALADGGCLDPCFVHTSSCSPDCLLLDGSCGWPPTK